MKALVQRVSSARVETEGEVTGSIGPGLLVLLGVEEGDTQADLEYCVRKVTNLRIFDDARGVMNLSVKDTGGSLLAVSQFTLAADTRRGNRPSYIRAAGHDLAIPMYEAFCRMTSEQLGRPTATGRFGADMQVSLTNDGPVTIIIDSRI